MDILDLLLGLGGLAGRAGAELSSGIGGMGLGGLAGINYDLGLGGLAGQVGQDLGQELSGFTWVVDTPGHWERRSRQARIPYIDHTAGGVLQGSLAAAAVVQAAAGSAPLLAQIAKLIPGS